MVDSAGGDFTRGEAVGSGCEEARPSIPSAYARWECFCNCRTAVRSHEPAQTPVAAAFGVALLDSSRNGSLSPRTGNHSAPSQHIEQLSIPTVYWLTHSATEKCR